MFGYHAPLFKINQHTEMEIFYDNVHSMKEVLQTTRTGWDSGFVI